ncbi:hypothetical protein ACIOWE_12570 [Pseudomonas sp. NPDC087598]|uniref:hypothetical protein n=1 Tax=Pseudomonas sp. NPDC087598 TaxID=3364440 RepID=UPI0037F32129
MDRMKIEENSDVTGTFTGVIDGIPFSANVLNVNFANPQFHIYGVQEVGERKFTSLYFNFKSDGTADGATFDRLQYQSLDGFDFITAETSESEAVTIDFNVAAGTYDASFKGVLTGPGVKLNIDCEFNLTKKVKDKSSAH